MFSVSLPPKQLRTTIRFRFIGEPLAVGRCLAIGPRATRPAPARENFRMSRRENPVRLFFSFAVFMAGLLTGGAARVSHGDLAGRPLPFVRAEAPSDP